MRRSAIAAAWIEMQGMMATPRNRIAMLGGKGSFGVIDWVPKLSAVSRFDPFRPKRGSGAPHD